MNAGAGAPSLHARLLALSREAHAARQHEAAYHALCAAMHAAHDEGNVAALEAIAAEARLHIAWIDAHDPAHRLATASAARHRHPGVYPMLARQAEAQRDLLAHASRHAAPPTTPLDG